jgi:SAM-dependent methyltransferase
VEYQRFNVRKLKSHYSALQCERIPRNARILDLGCGTGEFLDLLRSHGMTRLSGLEPDAELVSRGALSGVRQGSAADLPALGAEAFDAVFVVGVLHHLASLAEVKRCVRDIRNTLAPGGLFLSVEPRKSTLRSLATWVILDSPFWRVHPRLRMERTMLLVERRDMDEWLEFEKEVTGYCQTLFRIRHFKADWRYRYLVFEKARDAGVAA